MTSEVNLILKNLRPHSPSWVDKLRRYFKSRESALAAMTAERDALKTKVEQLKANGYACGRLYSLDGILIGGCGKNVDIGESYRCADCTASFHRDCIRRHFHAESLKDRDAWKSRAERMEKALDEYGDHKTSCRAWIGSGRQKGGCDCGYQEALGDGKGL